MQSEKRYLRRIVSVLIALSLLQSLSGCATTEPLVVTRTEKERVPQSLLTPCPVSVLNGDTYQAAIELALSLKVDLQECNRRLEDIRRWSEG